MSPYSPNSPVLLDVDDYDQEPNVRRARSNGHLDFLRDQESWRRRDRGLQMTAYRHGGHYGASQQRTGAQNLAVPMFEVSPRRQRASSDTRDTDRLSRSFKTLDVRPDPQPVSGRYSLSDSRLADAQHPHASTKTRTQAGERPKIKIPPVIIQEDPPISSTTSRRPSRSPSVSPRSPSGQPQLQHKYSVLQDKLVDIASNCRKYIDVEGADPKDLTFEKISNQTKGLAFDLKVWHHVSNVQNMPKIDLPENTIAATDAASRIMDRMIDRATELAEVCSKAKPNDLKFEGIEKMDEDVVYSETNDDKNEKDVTESLGYIIQSGLDSIKLQSQSLKRLTRSLQEATPDAREEVEAVALLVEEVARYFGTDEALKRYPVDQRFAGRRALEEAKEVAAR